MLPIYLIPDDANTVVHINGGDLYTGRAHRGPAWALSGFVQPNASCAPVPSVGPFGFGGLLGGQYVLPSGNPLSFGTGQSFYVTVVFSVSDTSSQPALVSCTSSADNWGWDLFIDGLPGPPHFFNFSMYNFATGLGAYELFSDIQAQAGQTYVVSAGYDDPTQTTFLKINTRPTLTLSLGYANQAPTSMAQIGTYHQDSPLTDFPLNGQMYEILAAIARPSEALFTSIYKAVQNNLGAFVRGPNPYPNGI